MHRTYFFRPGRSSRAGRTRNTKSFGQRYFGMKKRLAKMRTKYRSLINSNMEIIKKLSSMRMSYAASEEEHKQKNMSVIMKLHSVQLENQRLIQVIRNLSSSFRHVVTNMSSMSEHLFNINNVLDNYQTCNDEEGNDEMEQVMNHRESVLETRRRMSDNRCQLSLILEDSGDSNDDSNSETKPQVRVKSRLGLRHRQVPISQMSDSNRGEGSSGMSAQNVVTLRDESVRLNNVCCALVEENPLMQKTEDEQPEDIEDYVTKDGEVLFETSNECDDELGDKAEEEMEGSEKEEVSEVEDTVIEPTLGGQTLMETEALLNEETQASALKSDQTSVEKSTRVSSMIEEGEKLRDTTHVSLQPIHESPVQTPQNLQEEHDILEPELVERNEPSLMRTTPVGNTVPAMDSLKNFEELNIIEAVVERRRRRAMTPVINISVKPNISCSGVDSAVKENIKGGTKMDNENNSPISTRARSSMAVRQRKSSRTSSISGKYVEEKQKENALYKQNLRSRSAPKIASCDEPAGEVMRRSNRNRKVVNYREPNVGSKLRRI